MAPTTEHETKEIFRWIKGKENNDHDGLSKFSRETVIRKIS